MALFRKKTGTAEDARKAKETAKKERAAGRKKKSPHSRKSQVPYISMIQEQGIFQTPQGFTTAYMLADMDFTNRDLDAQNFIFDRYKDLISSFTPATPFQILIYNHEASDSRMMDELCFPMRQDGLDSYRIDRNSIFFNMLRGAANSMIQDRFLIVRENASSFEEAVARSRDMEAVIKKDVRAITQLPGDDSAVLLPMEERLHVLHSIYTQSQRGFYNAKDENGCGYLDFGRLAMQKIDTKDYILTSFDFRSRGDRFRMGSAFGQSMAIISMSKKDPSTQFLHDLASLPVGLLISIHYQPVDPTEAGKEIKNKLLSVEGQLSGSQEDAARHGYSGSFVSPLMRQNYEALNMLMDFIFVQQEKPFYITFVITHFSHTLDGLLRNSDRIQAIAKKHDIGLEILYEQQKEGFDASLPLCYNPLKVNTFQIADSAATFLPYMSQEMSNPGGVFYGIDPDTKRPILINRKLGPNFNGLVWGASGSGKTMSCLSEATDILLRSPDDQVIFIDPKGYVKKCAEGFGGSIIELAPGSGNYINPLDLDFGIEENGGIDALTNKVSFICSVLEAMLGEGGRLGFDAPSIIDRCVRSLYERANYRNHIREIQMYDASCTSDPMACPRLSELQAELRLQPEETAKALATVLEMYSGGESTFSQRTNVDLSSRFIVLDISGLGGNSMLTLTLLVCLEFIKSKMIENGKKGIYTHAYFDEFWCLLRSELASSYLSEMWKMCRVWKGVPTGIMQNTADLFGCPYASGILENTHFIMLHSLEQSDREAMRSLLRLSDEQVRRITNVAPGRGLIHTRGTTIPFENEYPEDSLSYKTFADSLQKRSLMPARRRLFTV